MSDMPLFDWRPYNGTPGHKVDGPSAEAAIHIIGRAATLRRACFERLKKVGNATADECAAALNESVLAVRPRFTELLNAGLIQDTGERRINASGRRATVWRVA